MNSATITHVFAGIEKKTLVENDHLDHFYATLVGTIQGITMAGETVTNLETHHD